MTAEATADVQVLPGGRHRIELAGSFTHPHWLAFLCGGLSAAGVSVVSGRAQRAAPMQWHGHLLVDGPIGGVDVVALASRRPAVRDAASPLLTAHSVSRRADGRFELSIEAPDALGFLGRLLSRVSLLALLPAEVEIATVAGRISDRFVLSGIGTTPPDDEVLDALRTMLASMTR
ncbi:MAG: hypothetical protein JWP14_1731 [Frankiales bacterium]|nr:hypothetical protein [Frankiales bacterium]